MSDSMSINQRLFKILDEKGISNTDLAKGTGIKTNTISDWRTKGTNPSADKIHRICEFLNITPTFLLTGSDNEESLFSETEKALVYEFRKLSELHKGKLLGRMEVYLEDYDFCCTDCNASLSLIKEKNSSYFTKKSSNISSLFKTELWGEISAGGGIDAIENREFIEAPIQCDFALRVKGDSMEPSFKNGSIIYLNKDTEITYNGEVAAVQVDELLPTCYLKKVTINKKNNTVRLISINPLYDDKVFSLSQVRILGKVIYPHI